MLSPHFFSLLVIHPLQNKIALFHRIIYVVWRDVSSFKRAPKFTAFQFRSRWYSWVIPEENVLVRKIEYSLKAFGWIPIFRQFNLQIFALRLFTFLTNIYFSRNNIIFAASGVVCFWNDNTYISCIYLKCTKCTNKKIHCPP